MAYMKVTSNGKLTLFTKSGGVQRGGKRHKKIEKCVFIVTYYPSLKKEKGCIPIGSYITFPKEYIGKRIIITAKTIKMPTKKKEE